MEIQDNSGPLYQAQEVKPKQSLEQIDQLTIAERTSKFVSYDPGRGIVFMLNQEKQDRHIRLFTVKLKREVIGDSDSEDGVMLVGGGKASADKSPTDSSRLRFEYVTETRLQIAN